MSLTAAAFAALIAQCALPAAPEIIAAIARVESGYDPLAVHDNSTGQSFHPPDIEHAQAYLADHAGNNIDAGLLQINSQNWARLGLNSLNVFDAQINTCAGLQVLREALSRYNTGHVSDRGLDYAQRVLTADVKQGKPVVPQPEEMKPHSQDGFGIEQDDEFANTGQKPAP